MLLAIGAVDIMVARLALFIATAWSRCEDDPLRAPIFLDTVVRGGA